MVVLRPAEPAEADALGEIARGAKAHWGYDADFMAAVRDELSFRPEEVRRRRIVVAAAGDALLGFYSLDGEPPDGELGNLWVRADSIGTGLGRRLWQHALAAAREASFTSLRIESDPHAEGFYLAMGAVRVGASPSGSIAGRSLPLLTIQTR
jgi:GNAT superfamily N-acetyltransferase